MKKWLVAVISIAGMGVVIGIQKKRDSSAVIALAGDTMLGRLVNQTIRQRGPDYPWGNVFPLLHEMDLNLVNLETVLTESDEKVPKVFNFKSDPEHVQSLLNASIDVVSLANNHSKDFGDAGLLQTIQLLDQAKIKHVGAGKDTCAAQEPVILEINGIKIGILGATDNEPDWKAGPAQPGTNYFSVNDYADLIRQIKAVKPQVDLLILSLHWGPNMRLRPTREYQAAAHAFIDAGVDIVHGHSAHVFQGIQSYKNKLILYDTGDFVDDYAVDEQLRNDLSFLFIITVTKSGPQKLQLIPLLISNMQVNYAPDSLAQYAIERMRRLSSEFKTKVTRNGTWNNAPCGTQTSQKYMGRP